LIHAYGAVNIKRGYLLLEIHTPMNELLRERRAVSPEMALRLSRLFGNTPEFWLNAQRAVDLWDAEKAIKKSVGQIKPLNAT